MKEDYIKFIKDNPFIIIEDPEVKSRESRTLNLDSGDILASGGGMRNIAGHDSTYSIHLRIGGRHRILSAPHKADALSKGIRLRSQVAECAIDHRYCDSHIFHSIWRIAGAHNRCSRRWMQPASRFSSFKNPYSSIITFATMSYGNLSPAGWAMGLATVEGIPV